MGKAAHFVLLWFFLWSGAAQAEMPAPLRPGDFHVFDAEKARLGRLLFYDRILSGNRNISCGTCHHHDFGSADGLSLGIGEGGVGVGPERTIGNGADRIAKRIPRNAPGLWNLGHKDIRLLFHDGRLEVSEIYGNGFDSPAEEWLPEGLDSILAAQAVFPLVAQFEMAGNPKENEIARAVHDRIDAAWPLLAKRVRTIPEYGQSFVAAFDDVSAPADVDITHIANALAAFVGTEWQSYDSAYDMWRLGEAELPQEALRGAALFFGPARCASCHSGPLFSDQKFHALGLPAFGPGRTRPFDPYARDVGRMAQTDRLEDAYGFRTPMLRNVTETAPYGHNGAFPDLEGIIRHHADPASSLAGWQPEFARLPKAAWLEKTDFIIQTDRLEQSRARAFTTELNIRLSDRQIADLVAFLGSLTGSASRNGQLGRPDSVPSGLPVD